MDDLAKWLGEQLDEDERLAQAAVDEMGGLTLGAEWRYDGHSVETTQERDLVATASQDHMEVGCGEHIAAHDPARVLREIDAKRKLLALYVEHERMDRETFEAEGEHARSLVSLRAAYFDAVRHHATVYADRPGYREEWRP